ncbi:MAG: lipid-A-disaccharide synthase [Zoogloeaceae bacterium]|jgi:lipid-A-disaccharide synthase|nr:lipid-A-disaccharide synthase [Zoogloeaceae bacterium]
MNSGGAGRAKKPRIAVSAGEVSGDQIAASMIGALKKRWPDAEFFGIGGAAMAAAGARIWWPMEKLSVMGYVEVLRRFWEILKIRRAFFKRLLLEKPDLFLGVDAPDFNMPLETKLRAAGIRTAHCVSPSVWAWRGGRIRKIGRAVKKMLLLFPMETPIYEKAGIPACFVGHPLADQIPLQTDKKAVREILRLPQDVPIYALLPGSRQGEVARLGGIFAETAKKIHEAQPDAIFLTPFVTRATRLMFEAILYKHGADTLSWRLLFGHAREALGAADAVLVASGTAALEAALIKRPLVIAYKLAPLTYRWVRRRLYLPYVGLPNILAGRFLVPEFLQDAATPDALAAALLAENTKERAACLEEDFTRIHEALRQGMADRAAECLAGELDGL